MAQADPEIESADSRMMRRRVWINELRTASYEWRVVRSDGSVLEEFDPEGVPGEEVLHKISEWPGAPKPLSLGTQKAFDADHNEVEIEQLLQIFVATEAFEPYELHAVPKTLEHQKLPDLMVKIEPGMAPIWGHRVRFVVHGGEGLEETLVFGRRLADGTDEIYTIYPDGAKYDHETWDAAIAHEHAPTKLGA